MIPVRPLRTALPALLLLAALPGALAKELPSYSVDSVDVQGTSVLQGSLAAVRMDGFSGPSPPSMEISSASGFAIRRDYQEVVSTPAVRHDDQPSEQVEGELPAGRILTAEYRPSSSLFVAPLDGEAPPRIQVQTRDSWSLQPASVDAVEQPIMFDGERSGLVVADVEGAIQIPDYGGGRDIVVEGSFVVIFYEWDIVSAESGEVVPSGETHGPIKPLPEESEGYVGKGYFNQTYVTVRNGTLTLGVEDARWADFYVRDVEAAIRGTATLREAIPLGSSAATPADVSYHGDVRLGVGSARDQPLTVQLLPYGDPEPGETVDTVDASVLDEEDGSGAQSAVARPEADSGTSLPTVAALALLLAGGWAFRAWHGRRRFRRLTTLMETGRYPEFLAASQPVLQSRRYGQRLAVMHAVAMLKTGSEGKVLGFLEALRPASRPAPATEAYLQACALAQLGQRKAAASRIAECLALDSRYAQEVQANPWFTGIRPRRLVAQHANDPEGYT